MNYSSHENPSELDAVYNQSRSTQGRETRKMELARSPEEMLASSGSARSDRVEMTKRSVIGFGGEGFKDAEGGTHSSLCPSIRFAIEVSSTTCCPPDQDLVGEEGTATAEATA